MSNTPYDLRVLQRVRDVPRQKWDALIGEDSSPFVQWTWLDMLEETGCVGAETGWMPAHLSVWRGDELVCVAPSYIKGNSEGEFVFDWNWAELADRLGVRYYPKVVVAVPFTPATGDRVLVAPGMDRAEATRIVAQGARQWCQRLGASSVHVLFPRENEAREWEAEGYLPREGFQFQWFRSGARTWDEYLERFSSKQRNQIKRELR
ncbi:MAG: GNAT family N-acetyltransferase, partial [Myxococcota bacterium]|nr:GNAT family N-acetyltransferase [Myxococcota bacterium]